MLHALITTDALRLYYVTAVGLRIRGVTCIVLCWPFLIQMACVIAFMITAILIIRCCWPNIRAWLGRTWYCCCWGPTPEEEQKQRQEENAKTFQRLTEELDNLRLQATKGAERWKQSSSNLWNNLQKARSLTNSVFPTYPLYRR